MYDEYHDDFCFSSLDWKEPDWFACNKQALQWYSSWGKEFMQHKCAPQCSNRITQCMDAYKYVDIWMIAWLHECTFLTSCASKTCQKNVHMYANPPNPHIYVDESNVHMYVRLHIGWIYRTLPVTQAASRLSYQLVNRVSPIYKYFWFCDPPDLKLELKTISWQL